MTKSDRFRTLVEVVPPDHGNPEDLLGRLVELKDLPISAFNVASNPVVKPHLSALVLAGLIQERTGIPAFPHCTTRDHNRLSLLSILWGAKALNIRKVLVTTGDYPAPDESAGVKPVGDLSVFDLLSLAVEEGFRAGVVLELPPSREGFQRQLIRLEKKIRLGAKYVITQPFYGRDRGDLLLEAAQNIPIPVYPGVLPLRTLKHARFMNERVRGIHVPQALLQLLERSSEPDLIGLENARDMLRFIRSSFPGVCLMPPFQRYNLVRELL